MTTLPTDSTPSATRSSNPARVRLVFGLLLLSSLLAAAYLWTQNRSLTRENRALGQQVRESLQRLESAQSELASLRPKLQQAAARLDLPVEVTFREAWLTEGQVAQLVNLSARSLPIHLSVTNATHGTARTFDLILAGRQQVELGYFQGWSFASGDQLRLTTGRSAAQTVVVP
jgi:hypothetical protein